MTLVTKIARLRHPGVLRDFTWPADLPAFGRYNLIYGWNGSGKTTLSNVFRALELRKSPECDATLAILSAMVAGDEFTQATLPVRVFNRDFVTASVFPVGGGEVPPIFVLGEESAEKQAQIELLKRQQAEANSALESAKQEKSKAEKALDKHCIDRASVIRDTLRSAGSNPYNSYDKASYKQRNSEMVGTGGKAKHLLSDNDRERLLIRSKATPKIAINEIQYLFPDLRKVADAASQLMQKTVVSSAIAALKASPHLASWTREGLGLHRRYDAEHCLFCEQPLPNSRIAALEGHFSTEYEQLQRQLDAQIAHIEAAKSSINQVALPNRSEFYEDLSANYDQAKEAFITNSNAISGYLTTLVEALESKKQQLFAPQPLEATLPEITPTVVDDINAVIKRHNQACADFDGHLRTARQNLEADSVSRSLDEYQDLANSLSAQETAINQERVTSQQLAEQIAQLERDIIEHRQPAEELNEDLHKYLGHSELSLDVKETGYIITRNGAPARSLSEGEMTAIALLYFLKSLQDRRFEIGNGLVVLDDPVSSLDANALFLAFSFIRMCTADVAQLIVLTHNFAMFRQVRNWFHHVHGQNRGNIDRRPARFYMMECSLTDQGRRSNIVPLDPLLEQFESEYHYLFSRVYQKAQANEQAGLEANYIFPNMARRLLETFLAFRRPQHAGDLRKKLQGIDFDEIKKIRILRFLHTQSHADAIGDPEHDPSALGEAQAVLIDLLALIQHEDSTHYAAMVALVDPQQAEEVV